MTKQYRITITEIGQRKQVHPPRWEPGAGPDGRYGHTPEIFVTTEYEEEVFSQLVTEDVTIDVITAVNGLFKPIALDFDPKTNNDSFFAFDPMVHGETPEAVRKWANSVAERIIKKRGHDTEGGAS